MTSASCSSTGLLLRDRRSQCGANWYVLARNAEKGQIETFALFRFRGIEAARSTFTRPADFDAQRYARQAFGITSGEKPIKVRLLFEPKLAVHVAEREGHPSQKLKLRLYALHEAKFKFVD